MTINIERLDILIDERSSKAKVAKEIGIDRSTFYRKLKGQGRGFSIEEAQKIAESVPLSNQEAIEIFFWKQSRENATIKKSWGGGIGGKRKFYSK